MQYNYSYHFHKYLQYLLRKPTYTILLICDMLLNAQYLLSNRNTHKHKSYIKIFLCHLEMSSITMRNVPSTHYDEMFDAADQENDKILMVVSREK